MTPDSERCETCGMPTGRKTRMGDPLPLELSQAHRRILDLEMKNEALATVNAQQAKRLLALVERQGHFAPMERTA